MPKKKDLVKQVAKYQAQLFRHQFPSIGNISVNPGARLMSQESPHSPVAADTKQAQEGSQQLLPAMGQLVSMIFFWGDHITQNVPRGLSLIAKT
jgi:hypothetical protein